LAVWPECSELRAHLLRLNDRLVAGLPKHGFYLVGGSASRSAAMANGTLIVDQAGPLCQSPNVIGACPLPTALTALQPAWIPMITAAVSITITRAAMPAIHQTRRWWTGRGRRCEPVRMSSGLLLLMPAVRYAVGAGAGMRRHA
jgi:hypothetical protein